MADRLTAAQRAVYVDEVRAAYDAYQAERRKIEAKIRAEVEKKIAAAEGDLLVGISKTLHEYYRKGVSKAALREATRKYGNNAEFLKLWDAYQPEGDFSLAVGRAQDKHYRIENGVAIAMRNQKGETVPEVRIIVKKISAWPDLPALEARDYAEKYFGGQAEFREFFLEELHKYGDYEKVEGNE